MAKVRTGTIEPFVNAAGQRYYRGKIRLGDSSRQRVDVPEPLCFDGGLARAYVRETQAQEDLHGAHLARKRGMPPPASAETVQDWGERWVKARDGKGYMSTRDDRSRLATHVYPLIGPKPMALVSRTDIEGIVEKRRTPRSARGRAVLADGVERLGRGLEDVPRRGRTAKQRDLRVREDNPCDRVAPPDRGSRRKAQQFLSTPTELLDAHGDARTVRPRVCGAWSRSRSTSSRARAELEALEWERRRP
jgi:hypothetical protein